MSVDEKLISDNGETDLVELFKSIWFYKFSLLIIIILSVPASLMYSTFQKPTYKAETVFEKPIDNNTQSATSFLNKADGLGVLSFLGSGPIGGAGDSFYSEIRSESF